MKLIYMSKTFEYIINSSANKNEMILWATNLINSGEVKETKSGIKYTVII